MIDGSLRGFRVATKKQSVGATIRHEVCPLPSDLCSAIMIAFSCE